MRNQSDSIRVFVDNKLAGLLQWPQVQVSSDSNADRASAVLPIRGHRFKVEVTSAYVSPALGAVAMTDLADNHEIRGPKIDATWLAIEAHIKRVTSGLPINAPIDEWKKPDVKIEAPASEIYTDERKPYLGQGVTYISDHAIGGMFELAAMVTKVIAPDVVCLTVFPVTGETFWRNDVRRSSEVRKAMCWEFSEPASGPRPEHVNAIREVLDAQEAAPVVMSLKAAVEEYGPLLAVNTETAPVKRGPGRPRKNAAA